MSEQKFNFSDLINEMKNMKETVWEIDGKTPEDDLYEGYRIEECPYNKCDGSGFIKLEKKGRFYSKHCKCYDDEILKRRLKQSKIEQKYWNSTYELDGIDIKLLKPKTKPEERKFKGKKPANPLPEEPMEYIERVYDVKPIKKGVEYFAEEYTEKTLQFLEETPRKRVQNLLLLGEPGRGKTHLACAVGREYLKQSRTVHFTTMMNLVNDVMNKEINIRKIVESVDLLIVDEVGYEYQTDTKWALKQIKEMFRIRYNKHLPIICTTNFYPNELAELYDPSLMSIFNGTFFFILAERENDYRLEEAEQALKEFTFIDEE